MSLGHRVQAYAELLRRYQTSFAFHWKRRNETVDRDLAEHEAEFLPAALSLQAKPVSPASRLLARVLMALVVVSLAWSIIGKIDIVVTATGKVIPSGYTKTIASVEIASVRALYVQEGQQVKAGDLLVELDSSAADADRDKAQGDRTEALLQVARAKALIASIDTGKRPYLEQMDQVPKDMWLAESQHLEGQYRDFSAKLQRLDGDIERYSQALPLASQVASDYKSLLADHDVSQHAWLEKERARVDLVGELEEAKNQRIALIAEARRTAYDQLTEATKAAADSRQDALRSDSHGRLLRLIAPVSGTVQQLDVHTVGGVVAAATPLMQIVPVSAQVEVEAFMDNKDVGFVQDGQDAEVKVDAFEYTKYGTVKGSVIHVSRDAIKDDKKGWMYSTKIALGKSHISVDGKDMPLSAGMTATVEIKTGERRIIEYVLSPLIRHQRESLNER